MSQTHHISRSEQQEIDTFTKWVNIHLKKRDLEVKDIFEDFRDGLNLIALYEQISGFQFPNYNKKPKVKLHCIENLRQVLLKIQEFLNKMNIKLQFGAEQIYGANSKDGKSDRVQVLGLLWVIISRFVIAADAEDEETKSLKADLLKWCRDNTANYDNVDIVNFKKSFQDGLALCALIHNFFPEKFDYSALDPENRLDNLKLATSTAETLGIDNLINEEEVAHSDDPSERSMMAYVGLYRQHLNRMAERAREAKRRALQKRQRQYAYNASRLLDSLRQRIDQLNNAQFDDLSRRDSLALFDELFKYRATDRARLTSQKTALDLDYIDMKRQHERENETYVPDEEVSPQTVNATFQELQRAETSYQQRLQEHVDSFRSKIEAFDRDATSYVEQSLELIQQGEGNVDENQQEADRLLGLYDELKNDDLAEYTSVDVSQIEQMREMIGYAFGNASMSDRLKSIHDEYTEKPQDEEAEQAQEEQAEEGGPAQQEEQAEEGE